MNDTNHIDELIEEMKEYNEMIDNNKKRNQDIVEYEEEVTEDDLEKTKENIIEYEEKVSEEDISKTKVITGTVTEDKITTNTSNNENDNENELTEEEKKEEDKKFNRTVIITIVVVCVVSVLVLVFLIVLAKNRSKTVSIKDDDIISKSEYKEIIKEYGDLLTDNVKEYMLAYNNKVPTFLEVTTNTNYKHKVVCTKTNINYDGSVYLDDCLIDNYTNKYKYTYGTYLEEVKEDNTSKKIYIYKNNKDKEINYYALNNTIDIENIELVDTYKCSSDECKGYNTSTNNNKDVIIYDGAYYLYNPISKVKNEVTGLSNDIYMFIDLMTRSDGTSYALYLTRSDGYGAFYRIDKKVLVTDYLYSSNTTTNKLLEAGYFGGVKELKNNSTVNIIHQNTGEEVYTFKDVLYISDTKIDGVYYYYLGGSLFGEKTGCFITSGFNKIVPNKDTYIYSINSDNTITIKNNNTFEVYDFTGKKVYTSSSYSNVLKLLKDYVIVSTDKEVKILDNKGKVITKFFDTKSSYEYHTTLTDSEHSNGSISMIVLDKSISDGVEGRGVEFTYNISTKEIKVIKMTTVGGHD